jgi:hypothetical protein
MTPFARLSCLIVAGSLLWIAPANAQDGVGFASAQVGRDWSVSAGFQAPVFGSELGRGWAVRAAAAVGGYDYSSGAFEVEGEYRQADLSLLRQTSGQWGYFNIGGGVRVTDTDLSPADPGNPRSGSTWDALIVADGMVRSGAWETTGYVSWAVEQEEYFARLDVTRALPSGRLRVGAEVLAEGDRMYDRQGAGLVAIYGQPPAASVRGAVGVRGGEGYVSLGLVRAF